MTILLTEDEPAVDAAWAQLKHANDRLRERDATIAAQAERIEALEADKDRLDFLDDLNRRLNAHYGTNYRWELVINHNVNRLMFNHIAVDLNDAKAHGWPSCRIAIDWEMTRIAAGRRALLSPASLVTPKAKT